MDNDEMLSIVLQLVRIIAPVVRKEKPSAFLTLFQILAPFKAIKRLSLI